MSHWAAPCRAAHGAHPCQLATTISLQGTREDALVCRSSRVVRAWRRAGTGNAHGFYETLAVRIRVGRFVHPSLDGQVGERFEGLADQGFRLRGTANCRQRRGAICPFPDPVILRSQPAHHSQCVIVAANHKIGVGKKPCAPQRVVRIEVDRPIGHIGALLGFAKRRGPRRIKGHDLELVWSHSQGRVKFRLGAR